MFGRQKRLFSTASKANYHHTLHRTPFFQCTLAVSERWSANNLFIYSSHPWHSCLLVVEAQGAILHVTSTVAECAQNL